MDWYAYCAWQHHVSQEATVHCVRHVSLELESFAVNLAPGDQRSSVWKVSNYWRTNCTSVKISIRTHTHKHTLTLALAILDRHLANNHKSHAKPSDHPTLSLCTEKSMLHLSIFIFCVTEMTKKSMPCGNLCELKVLDILVRQAFRGSAKQWWIPHAKQ